MKMNEMMTNVGRFAAKAKFKIGKHSPEILMVCGAVGAVTSAVMACKATLKVNDILKDHQSDVETIHNVQSGNAEIKQDAEYTEEDAKKDLTTVYVQTGVKLVKLYAPAVILGGLSLGCMIGSNHILQKRNAALTAAYTLSESTLRTYRDKVLETVGEDKEREIRQKDAIEQQQKTPEPQALVVSSAAGQLKCFDSLSGRYFVSTKNEIDKAVNEFNRQLRDDMRISLNDWYDLIGLDTNKLGDMLGWDIERGYVETCYASRLDEDGLPCLVVNYVEPPHYIGV